jgi:hydroxymethylpyrimidine/phosphomethylpyrimidine kinase
VKRVAERPWVLVAAGLDPSGRAGLLADVAAVLDAGGQPLGVATALTAQGRRFTVAAGLLGAQLDAALEVARPRAVKVGMVADRRSLAVVRRRVARLGVPLVVDPVVWSSRGQRLSRLGARDFRGLAGPGVWLTPNVPELQWLLGRRVPPRSVDEVKELGATLLADGFGAVVVKGGHLPGLPVDVLVMRNRVVAFSGARLGGGGHRGTGCRFASTLATALALGADAVVAVRAARAAVRSYLRS